MTTPLPFARYALLLTGSAALAGVVAVAATPSYVDADAPALAALPWPAVVGAGMPTTPLALLYVSERCSHCAPAAMELARAAGNVRVLVVATGSDSAASRYGARMSPPLHVAADTAGDLARALDIRVVPTLVAFRRDGTRARLVGFRGPGSYTRTLRSLR